MVTSTYQVRTYGCQMNVHDSERIAGLLDEAGNAPVADGAQPDVVVFSTCAVRENADNKLDGNLGHLKPVKDRTPGRRHEGRGMSEETKAVVQRMIDEVFNAGRLEVIDELYWSESAESAKRWVEPFRLAFPDFEMQTLELVAEGDRVVGRFRCSGTHLGPWHESQPTGRRMHDIDEVYFFTVRDGRIADTWGIEDTAKRIRQLGL